MLVFEPQFVILFSSSSRSGNWQLLVPLGLRTSFAPPPSPPQTPECRSKVSFSFTRSRRRPTALGLILGYAPVAAFTVASFFRSHGSPFTKKGSTGHSQAEERSIREKNKGRNRANSCWPLACVWVNIVIACVRRRQQELRHYS